MKDAVYRRMRKLGLIAITLGFCYSTVSHAQSRDFEVSSIKPTRLQGEGVKSACHGIDSKFSPKDLAATIPLGRCVITSGRLSHMIGVAYNITMDTLKGGPEWVMNGDNRFDLEAKAEDPSTATEADLQVMLQRLLGDRFKLKFHRETQEVDGMELVVAKNGPKVRQAGPDEEEMISLGGAGSQNIGDAKKAAAEDVPATGVLAVDPKAKAQHFVLEHFLQERDIALSRLLLLDLINAPRGPAE